MPRKSVNLRFDPELWERIKVQAARENRTATNWLETAARERLHRMEVQNLVNERRWDGWTIRTGFLAGNLMERFDDADQYDEDESAREYARLCEQAIASEYPGAKVEVLYQLRASGATPATLETVVIDPQGGIWRPDEYPAEGSRIASRVDAICGEVWESMEWLVYMPRR